MALNGYDRSRKVLTKPFRKCMQFKNMLFLELVSYYALVCASNSFYLNSGEKCVSYFIAALSKVHRQKPDLAYFKGLLS